VTRRIEEVLPVDHRYHSSVPSGDLPQDRVVVIGTDRLVHGPEIVVGLLGRLLDVGQREQHDLGTLLSLGGSSPVPQKSSRLW
jgi:hypothetical protein